MDNLRLAEGEYRFACIVWEHEPLPSGKLVELCAKQLGWKKSTTYTVLKKLVDRGVLRNDNAVVTAAVPKEEVLREESRAVVDRTFEGSLPSFLAHFMGGKTISDAEADELKAIIDRFREGITMLDLLSALYQSLTPLWEMSVTAAYVSAIIIVLRLLLKKRAPKQVLCLLWLVVFARLLIPVSLESPLSIVPDALPRQEQQIAVPGTPQGGKTDLPQNPVQDNSQTTPVGGGVSPVTGNPTEPSLTIPEGVTPAVPQQPEKAAFPWQAIVAGVWLAGAAAMGGYALFSYFRLRRRLFDAIRAKDGAWEHPAVDSPFILGMFRPRIYLPAGLVGRPRKFILCHERAHLRRFDHIVKPVCWIALALHWFNPLVWAAFILMSRDIESACDEAVVRRLGSQVKADYSTTLLALATGRRAPSPCPLAFDEGDARGRIQNVLRYRRPALWVIVVSAIAAVLAAVCLLTDPVAAESPEDPDADASPEVTATQPPVNLADTVLDPWMKEILDGERTFSAAGPLNYVKTYTIDQLKLFYYEDQEIDTTVELGKLAIVDMDRDGINEMVIFPQGTDEYLYSYVGYLILLRNGDDVFGFAPGWRSCENLKADGTFRWSSSAFESGTASAYFTDGMFQSRPITQSLDNGNGMRYFVDGERVDQEAFEAAMAAQDAKPEPTWYAYIDGVLSPILWDGMELLGKTDVLDTGEAKLYLEGGESPWLEWNGTTQKLGGLITPAQFSHIACRDFDGDGQDEVVVAWMINGFMQLDLYEWDGYHPILMDSYDTQQILVRFNKNNVAGYNKDTRGLTVTYAHTDPDSSDDSRRYVTGSSTLPEGFFDGYENIRDGYTYAYAHQFRTYVLNETEQGATEYYFDFEFCLADETMKELNYVDTLLGDPPYSEYAGHHMYGKPVGVASFDLWYDGTRWNLREGNELVMDNQAEPAQITDITTAAPLGAPVRDIYNAPDDPNEWFKVAELPDDMIWMYTRSLDAKVLLRWDGNFYKVFDHLVRNPQLKKLGGADTYGPLAVIDSIGTGTGVAVDELVVYDLDANPVVDYTHDWRPLMDDFNNSVTWRYGQDNHTLIYAYQGQMVEATVEADDSIYRRIEQEGISLRVTGNHVNYWYDRVNDGDIKIELTIEAFVGNDVLPMIVPGYVAWTVRFNGGGFDVVPGSCQLGYPGSTYQ